MSEPQNLHDDQNHSAARLEQILVGLLKVPGVNSDSLQNLLLAAKALRPPRIMVVGRSRSGKSSLINAICGLYISKVSHVKPETGRAEWKEYHKDGVDLVHILDTRGFQESEKPERGNLDAETALGSLKQAVVRECPDVILFVCKADEVGSAIQEDIQLCSEIHKYINSRHRLSLPVMGVLTQCDKLALSYGEDLPTDNPEVHQSIQEAENLLRCYLAEKLKSDFTKAVIPTVSRAQYQPGDYGLIIPGKDYRWNIDLLVETMMKYTPKKQAGLARMAGIEKFQLSVANTVVGACAGVAGSVSVSTPVPGSNLPIVGAIQSFMVMYIAWLAGRKLTNGSVEEFVKATGLGVGVNVGGIGLGDVAVQFIPGFGQIISAIVSGSSTHVIGEAAIQYFLKRSQ